MSVHEGVTDPDTAAVDTNTGHRHVSADLSGTAADAAVRACDLHVELGHSPVLRGIDLTLARGRLTGVVGPNGSGKTTLLRAIFRGVRPSGGAVFVDGVDVDEMRGRDRARTVAAAVQEPGHPPGLTAREVVAIGRHPHHGDLGRPTQADLAAMERAAAEMGVDGLLDRELATLSGGERQRVHIARALAQEAPTVILDEPTNHLDIGHQFTLLRTLQGLTRARGTTIAVAMHDLSAAARWCDDVAVLRDGHVAAFGPPRAVVTAELTAEVFAVASRWDDDEDRLLLDPLD